METTPLLQSSKQATYLPTSIKNNCTEHSKPNCCKIKSKGQSATSVTEEDDCYLSELKWEYKAVALSCALLIAVGSHFAAHTLGAMKNTIKEEFGISNSKYGMIQSSVAIVNTVLPVIGGIFIDAFGTISGSVLTTFLITSGNVLIALSTSTRNVNMMILGRILYGIGSGTVVIVQETILSQWFRGRSLAAVVALMLTVSRLASFLAQAIVVPIANWTGWYGYGFWFSALLCIFSFVVNLVYIALLKKVSNPSMVACKKQTEVIKRKKSFSWKKLLFLPHSYWLIAAMEFLLGGGWGCFLHINSEFVKLKFGYSNLHAAAIASTAQILPVILMPFLGICVDRFGRRTWMMIGSGMTMLFSILILGYTNIAPIIGMLIFSVSLSLGPVGLVSSIPVILPLSLIGTGMGIVKSMTNIGSAIFDISVGLLQDYDEHKGYSGVVKFFIVISSIAVLCAITLSYLDHRMYNNILDTSARKAYKSNEHKLSNAVTLEQNRANWVYGSIYALLAITSWILFFHFVLV